MKEGKIQIVVQHDGDFNDVKIIISADEEFKKSYGYLMCASEYLLNTASLESPKGYDKAMDLICKGARTYKNIVMKGKKITEQ